MDVESHDIVVGNRLIGPNQPCFIAAEVGINHNGDMELAHKSIDAAAKAGADGVKFQNFAAADFVLDDDLTHTYRSQGKEVTEFQWDLFKRCELSTEQLADLKDHCDHAGVVFFSTPTSEAGVEELRRLDSPLLKNGSDYLTNLELIGCMARADMPTVLSTGMATVAEIDDAVRAFRDAGGRDLVLLQCTSSYPTPPTEINLRRIPILAETFGCASGFSDHSAGHVAAVGARVLGASIIEKHFTLDNNLPGPDHWFSSDPEQFRQLVDAVRSVESALGSGALNPMQSEVSSRASFRLSCRATSDIAADTSLQRNHLAFMRPGTGIAPKHVDSLVGMKLKHNVQRGHVFVWEDFK